MTENDLKHWAAISTWFQKASSEKYTRGAQEHGGELPAKGGLLNEMEMECLDQTIYVRTIRVQLEQIFQLMREEKWKEAKLALGRIIYGSPNDLVFGGPDAK